MSRVLIQIVSTHVVDGETMHVGVIQRRAPRSPRPGWERISSGIAGKGRVYEHTSGWQVAHCGHATAIYPYSAGHPDGRTLVSPSGRGFRHLVDAMQAAESAG